MNIPLILSGPAIRRAAKDNVCISVVTSEHCDLKIELAVAVPYQQKVETVQLGTHLFLHFIVLTSSPERHFCTDEQIEYRLFCDEQVVDLSQFYLAGQKSLGFVIPNTLNQFFHGSCRNPHHPSADSLVAAATELATARAKGSSNPNLLLMSGDQIYADDVAGPMLIAVQALITRLGIFRESTLIEGVSPVSSDNLYKRAELLPNTPWQERSKTELGYWLRRDKIHFTSLKSKNHLVHFEEFVALYVLTTSHTCWQLILDEYQVFDTNCMSLATLFEQEKLAIDEFIKGLPDVERLLANISCLMMFDDHDVTDDWNLTADWEVGISSNQVSRRIVANGLISYLLFQGAGNDALEKTNSLIAQFKQCLIEDTWRFEEFDTTITEFGDWHYALDTNPNVIVLDTRTHRWRNEQNFDEPSGLMDWESLCELENKLINKEHVVIVSPAPVFGVKSIEAIQAGFNICGQPLLVDVENWMAHEGAARKLMQMFKRADTPVETLILSGDVHYSFCFSVKARFKNRDNRIWQLTASGIKNEFPNTLLDKLDRLDNIFYGKYSPLNFFTKRWQMKVDKHLTKTTSRHLVGRSAISMITLDNGKLVRYELLHGDGSHSEFEL